MTETIMGTSPKACVRRGYALLSGRFDGWQQYIDRYWLDLSSPVNCIVGQLNAKDPRFGGPAIDPYDNYGDGCAVIFPDCPNPSGADMRVTAALYAFTAPLHMGGAQAAAYLTFATELWRNTLTGSDAE